MKEKRCFATRSLSVFLAFLMAFSCFGLLISPLAPTAKAATSHRIDIERCGVVVSDNQGRYTSSTKEMNIVRDGDGSNTSVGILRFNVHGIDALAITNVKLSVRSNYCYSNSNNNLQVNYYYSTDLDASQYCNNNILNNTEWGSAPLSHLNSDNNKYLGSSLRNTDRQEIDITSALQSAINSGSSDFYVIMMLNMNNDNNAYSWSDTHFLADEQYITYDEYETDLSTKELGALMALYENKFSGNTVYTNMSAAYEAYKAAQLALDEACKTGDDSGLAAAKTNLQNAMNNMGVWTAYTGNKADIMDSSHRVFGDWDNNSNAEYKQIYKNVLYVPTSSSGMNSNDYAATDVKNIPFPDSGFTFDIKFFFGDTVLLYDGITTPQVGAMMACYGNTKPWNWNWNNVWLYSAYINNTTDIGFDSRWKGIDGRLNHTWIWSANAQNPNIKGDGDTTSTHYNQGTNSEKYYANIIKVNKAYTAEDAIMIAYTPTFAVRGGYDGNNGANSKLNDVANTTGRQIRVLNYKKVVDAMANNYFKLKNVKDYRYGGLEGLMTAYDKATIDPNSYFTSSNNYSACSTNYTEAYNGLTASYSSAQKPSFNHNEASFSAWTTVRAETCTESGEKSRVCKFCGLVKTESIPALGHDMVVDAEVTPTCTATGLTEGSHCSRCDGATTAQESVPALGHLYKDIWSWNDDNTVATVNFECEHDSSHNGSQTVNVGAPSVEEASSSEIGVKIYQANTTFNGSPYWGTKREIIPMNALSLVTYSNAKAEFSSSHYTFVGVRQNTDGAQASVSYFEATDTVNESELDYSASAEGAYGTLSVQNGVAVYTPNTMSFNDVDTFWVVSKINDPYNMNVSDKAYVWQRVDIVPSRTLYYEDSFENGNGITYNDSNDATGYGTWSVTAASPAQAAVNGVDIDTQEYATLSNGSAHTVSVADINSPSKGGAWPSMTFDFSGTGFDVIGLTDSNSGVFYVTVKNANGETVRTNIIDTYYGYKYCQLYYNTATKKIVDNSDENTIPLYVPNDTVSEEYIIEAGLMGKKYTTVNTGTYAYGWLVSTTSDVIYQVPVLKVKGLEYGTYTVKIEARFTGMFGHYNTDSDGNKYFNLCVDAIRIYDPAGQKLDDTYALNGEGRYVTETAIKDKLISNDRLNNSQNDDHYDGGQEGALFIDGTNYEITDDLLKDFLKVSPKNEVYLNKDQSITFSVNTNGYADVQIGMRSVGKPVSVTVAYDNETWNRNINNATQTYYSFNAMFSSNVNGTITITNTSDTTAILSLTNIKTVSNENVQVEYMASPMMLYPQTATEAMALLCMENSDLSVDEEKTQVQTSDDGTVKLTVVTSNDVSTLIITDENGNGIIPKEIKNAPGDGDTIVWTVTLSESESGVYTYYIQGAYENGYTNCEPISVTVVVEMKGDDKTTDKLDGNFFERLLKAIIDFLNRLFTII